MSEPQSYRLRLGESTLVFFPPQARDGGDLHEPHVVQVMVKPQTRFPTREEVAAYYDAQEEITAAVEVILLENIVTPLHRKIELDGNGYSLTAEKKDWAYGRGLALKWGDEKIRACNDKWVFHFRTCHV
ncbi:hypothetical protein B0H17DRAFT_1215294 [Mycena rosella]|uniref:Uncharacterized protein n=1 Tax=Mycena rosella TaxID=1033263 RepID=A0AAD7CHT1_MYCRO|nr:hypothetical protein B0H17DRAFT_1215294 [Mycena rosella]